MSRHLRPPGQIPLPALPSAHLLPATFIGATAFSFALAFFFFLAKPLMATQRTAVKYKKELL